MIQFFPFLAFSLLLIPTLASAEPPQVTAEFPAGGQRGTEVRVKLMNTADSAATQVWSDRPGIELVGADGKDAVKLKLAADAPLGIAWLRFHNADGASALRPFVIGSSPELLETEPNDSLTQAQALDSLPTILNGTLEKSGEVDAFRVALKRGETLVAVLAAKQSLGSPMDGLLQVTDANGFVLDQNDDRQGFDPQIAFSAPRDGDYFVRVFAFPSQPNTTVQFSGAPTYIYRLTLSTGPFLDHLMPCALPADQPANVRLFGWNLPPDTVEFSLPPLPAGIQAFFHDGWESTAQALVTPHPSVVEQEPNPLAQPQGVAVPGVMCGVIGEAKDVDAWKFSAKAGQKFSMRLTARALGSALDAVVRFYDAAGQKLAEVDDAPQDEADAVLEFTAPKDDEYVVSVTDRFAHGGRDYWYALSLAEPQPNALLQVASDNFTVITETSLEIPITIERRQGFALPLTIAVEGLPEGVTADAVVSEPSGDSSKTVKLVLKSTRTERWAGPIRIVGKADGDSQPQRAARTKSPVNEEWLPHLWLTALPK